MGDERVPIMGVQRGESLKMRTGKEQVETPGPEQ